MAAGAPDPGSARGVTAFADMSILGELLGDLAELDGQRLAILHAFAVNDLPARFIQKLACCAKRSTVAS